MLHGLTPDDMSVSIESNWARQAVHACVACRAAENVRLNSQQIAMWVDGDECGGEEQARSGESVLKQCA